MGFTTGARKLDGTTGSGGSTTTTGNVSATSVTTTGAIVGATLKATNTGDPISHSDTVNPAIHCAGGMSVAGLLWSNSLRTTQHHIVSDARTKHSIAPLAKDTGASVVRALNPVSYVINLTGDATVGFVAQEVEKLDPRLVAKTAQDEYSLDYRGISVHTVHAVQALQQELDALRASVRAMEQRQNVERDLQLDPEFRFTDFDKSPSLCAS